MFLGRGKGNLQENKDKTSNRKRATINLIMEHKVLSTGLHTILDKQGRVHVFTESEYTHLSWWRKVKMKYNF